MPLSASNQSANRRREFIQDSLAGGNDAVWRQIDENSPGVASRSDPVTTRSLFTYALALCESQTYLDRLVTVFKKASELQLPNGNFKWNLKGHRDANAAAFCLRGASQLVVYHRKTIHKTSPEAWKLLRKMVCKALGYCAKRSRRNLPEDYTNMMLLNSMNLILLGNALNRPGIAKKAHEQLDALCIYTWEWGIHEFCSPTYTGIQIYSLGLLNKFCAHRLKHRPKLSPKARRRIQKTQCQTQQLLKLFWHTVAANQLAAKHHIGGSSSRKLGFYLERSGERDILGQTQWAADWLAQDERKSPRENLRAIYSALCLDEFADQVLPTIEPEASQIPRLITHSWGPTIFHTGNSRTHLIYKDVTLSAVNSAYDRRGDRNRRISARQSMPLTIDFPDYHRCYFVADDQNDPFGKRHSKKNYPPTLWAATQHACDALALVLYHPDHIPPKAEPKADLVSYFVLPVPPNTNDILLEHTPLDMGDQNLTQNLNQPLFLRLGTAAVGIKLLWTRTYDGREFIPILKTEQWNNVHTLRLEIHHGVRETQTHTAGLALWVRIGTELGTDGLFRNWRQQFIEAVPDRVKIGDHVPDIQSAQIAVPGKGDMLQIDMHIPNPGRYVVQTDPPPSVDVLNVNGKDVGREMLNGLALIQKYEKVLSDTPAVSVSSDTYWEAESGRIHLPMKKAEDARAHNGSYVWMPEGSRLDGSEVGSATWILDIPDQEDYYLWGRVLTPHQKDKKDPYNDSFSLRITKQIAGGIGSFCYTSAWRLEQYEDWTWRPVAIFKEEGTNIPTALTLPKGQIRVQLFARGDGAKLDQLFITSNPTTRPQKNTP